MLNTHNGPQNVKSKQFCGHCGVRRKSFTGGRMVTGSQTGSGHNEKQGNHGKGFLMIPPTTGSF